MKDLVIVGGGPIGIYASTLAALHSLDTLLIEGQENLGGQLYSLYPEKDIIDLPGYNRITALEYINKLVEQLNEKDNKPEIHLNEEVKNFEKTEYGYKVITS